MANRGWKRMCNPITLGTLGFILAMIVSMVTLYFSVRANGTNLDALDESIQSRLGEQSSGRKNFADRVGGQFVLQVTGSLVAPFVAMIFSGFVYLSHQAQLDKLVMGIGTGEGATPMHIPDSHGTRNTATGTDNTPTRTSQHQSDATLTGCTIVTNNIATGGNNSTTQISTNVGDTSVIETTQRAAQVVSMLASNDSRN